MPSIRSVVALHSVQRDRKSAEESLRKLSQAVEQSADVVMVTDKDGIIEYVNPAFEALTGYSYAEVAGKTPRVLKSGQQTSEDYQQLWQTILSGNVYCSILANRRKNGEPFVFALSVRTFQD